MGRRLFVLMLLVSGLVGCSVSSTLGDMNGDYAVRLAQETSTANVCAKKGLIDKSAAHTLGYVSTQIMSLFDNSSDFYERGYIVNTVKLSGLSEDDFYFQCAKLKYQLPALINKITGDYRQSAAMLHRKQAKERQDAKELLFMAVGASQELGQQAQNMGNAANGFTYDQINNHQGSSVTGFNVDENGTNHYLINTDSGTVQCHVTPSGYTFCN